MSDVETDVDLDDLVELDLDTSLGEVKEDLYWATITKAEIKKNPDNGKISARIGLTVCDGPYEGTKATDIIGLDMSKGFNAKKIKQFLEAVLSEKLSDNIKVPLDRDVNGKPQIEGVVGEQVGVYLKSSEEGFVNVTMKGYVPYSPGAKDGDEDHF